MNNLEPINSADFSQEEWNIRDTPTHLFFERLLFEKHKCVEFDTIYSYCKSDRTEQFLLEPEDFFLLKKEEAQISLVFYETIRNCCYKHDS